MEINTKTERNSPVATSTYMCRYISTFFPRYLLLRLQNICTFKPMASSGTWINPVVRYRINQDSLKQDMQEYPDIEAAQFHDIDANFGATLNDTIAVINKDYYRTRTKTMVLSDTRPPLRLPRFLKVRVYCARLLGR
jgi:hypothetical protein